MPQTLIFLTDRLDVDVDDGPADGPADGSADVLADLLDTLRLRTLVHGRFELTTPWDIQFPDDDPAYLIVVGHGDALLDVHGLDKPLSLSAGDTVLLPYGGPHRLRDTPTSTATTLVVCAFRFRPAHRTLSLQHLSHAIHLEAGDSSTGPSSIAQQLIAESDSPRPGSRVVMGRLADVLLVEAIRAHIASTECPMHSLRALTDPQIGAALTLIHRDPARPWTVASLASAVTLSRSVFSARFTRLVGSAPAEYLLRWRMTKAAELLRDDSLAIGEITTRSGYLNEASFNRAFKRVNGIAPGAYRRRARADRDQ